MRTALLPIAFAAALVGGAGDAAAIWRCDDLAKGFDDVVPNRSDTVIVVGQDFDTILERGYMTFAFYEEFPPFSWEEGGRPRGIDIDIAKVVADEIGVEGRFHLVQADETVDADLRNYVWRGPVVSGTVHNVMFHVPYNKDFQCRNEFVVLGGQYYNETLATAYRRDTFPDGAPTTGYFRYHKVGVDGGSLAAFYLQNFGGGMLLPNVVTYYGHREAFEGMMAGEVDAVMGIKGILRHLDVTLDDGSGDAYAVDTPPLVNFGISEWTLGIAVNFRYRELFYTVDGIIADMQADGRMERIFADYGLEWTPPDY